MRPWTIEDFEKKGEFYFIPGNSFPLTEEQAYHLVPINNFFRNETLRGDFPTKYLAWIVQELRELRDEVEGLRVDVDNLRWRD